MAPQGDVVWIVPDWPAPPSVAAVMSTRRGGQSHAPFDTMNLRAGIGDAAAAVLANQALFARRCGAAPVWLQQVHGCGVVQLDGIDAASHPEADAALASRPGRVCAVQVADCLPVLLAAADGRAVAAVHAGWRGLAHGVVDAAVAAVCASAGCAPSSVLAWLGPCIGPQAFEVGRDVLVGFGIRPQPGDAAPGFVPRLAGQEAKWLGDLPGLARRRLIGLGVTALHGNDGGNAWCTVANPSWFFSYRRDGVTGRLAAGVWLLG